ncbi:hypothetical protein PR202_gb09487 [Eleusine coracana subsp. coracana]|uniref:PRONE domain-containing protein n=1 Tax=Eleusine coracana subsp. coracana TaxID=191504 RepID=A0AAV5EGX2_ELECO|nr:hypothetical protein PR202_gb09487 [Eleusine coracana subsp. coracana]
MRMKTLACCRRRPQDFSIDMDKEPDRVMTYNGLEACIINSSSYDDDSGISATTGADGCVATDSLDDEVSSCSSSKDVCGSSFSSHCLSLSKQDDEHSLSELGTPSSIHLLPLKGKNPVTYTLSASDIENMKEKFAKLLLGDDSSGGARGVCTALALSSAITSLSATVFGELWKLEPLCEEKDQVAKGNGLIMTPKARSDVHVNLPALQKLDSMLISGRASLGEDLYHAITTEYIPIEEIFVSLSLKTEHSVLETINRLEGAVFAWNQRISDERNKRLPARHSWNFMKDSSSELQKMSVCVERVETLVQLLKTRFPNLPPTFIDVLKVQYNVDVGHAIVEAYSRILVGVAFSILSRVAEVMLEDDLIKKPNTPMATLKFDLSSDVYLAGITETPPGHIRRSLMDQISLVDGRFDPVVKKKGVKQLRW